MKAKITYEHDVRVEIYPFLRESVREAVYNALEYNNYVASVPIQIRIEDNVIYISNNFILPQDWTAENLAGNLSAREQEYTVLGDDITIKFFALKSAVISDSKIPKHQGDVLDDVLEFKIL